MSRSKKNKKSSSPNKPDEQLASEYALGILTQEEKSRADILFAYDSSFRSMVEKWQERVAPMTDEVGEETASDEVWRELEGQLFSDEIKKAPKKRDFGAYLAFWSSLVFWRGLSVAFIAVAAVLIGIIVLRPLGQQIVPIDKSGFVAALILAEGKPTFFVQMDMISGKLNIRSANLADDSGTVPELWLMPDRGAPLSLGILFANGDTTLHVAASMLQGFKSGATLAVSLEPIGGAPKGVPTGPIVATGPLQHI